MIPHGTHAMGYFRSYIVFYCHLLNFRMWFMYGLKAQKLLAQGIALGMMAIIKTPCKGKSFMFCLVIPKQDCLSPAWFLSHF